MVPSATDALRVPLPRRPLTGDRVQRWYEEELGWAVAPGAPVRLRTGLRFDVLEMPAAAGHAVCARIGARGTGPVALHGATMRFLVAAGSADELPGLLDWLEWGSLALDLRAVGTGGLTAAPLPPAMPLSAVPDPRGAAVWLRPPEPGCEVEPVLPALTALGGSHAASPVPDLVRLVSAAATECHRARLLSAAQPLAFW
ncbi:SCO3374 family protein [Streptomyces sp. NPDC050418]|uniref:SCO3374 family protein n=1 Tax=Streptomyces sp. NPDC050418 TaxID=3365612 RepID=UPI0037A053BD